MNIKNDTSDKKNLTSWMREFWNSPKNHWQAQEKKSFFNSWYVLLTEGNKVFDNFCMTDICRRKDSNIPFAIHVIDYIFYSYENLLVNSIMTWYRLNFTKL